MQIALIADLHGNRPATEALASDLTAQAVERVICLGDIVGKGPSGDFTFDWAFAHCELILGGNWDYGVGKRMFSPDLLYWEQLGEERLRKLRELPREHELWLSGRRIRLFHGRPVMSELVVAQNPAELIDPFFTDDEGMRYDVVVYADAHRQAMRTMSPGLFINVGSVGNALGVPKCCYAILCGEEGKSPAPFELRLRQLDYDRAQAVRDAQNAPLVPRIEAYIREIETGVYSR
ncbi:MAG: metallophosphoesterase family protein [Clostridia bacterium]